MVWFSNSPTIENCVVAAILANTIFEVTICVSTKTKKYMTI